MSNPEQEKILATIAALTHSLLKHELSPVQLDQLQITEHLLTNISVQLQMEASNRAAAASAEPAQTGPIFQPSEPCKVMIPADRVQHEHWELATIIGVDYRPGVAGGFVYQTSKTGKTWLTSYRLKKVSQE